MASVTAASEPAGMRVVAPMTGIAVVANDSGFTGSIEMTAGAGNRRVCTDQRKTGIALVVEVPGTPVRRVVAPFALSAESAAVYVLSRMTGYAGTVGVVECRGLVAAVALHQGMCANQREMRDVVVEPELRRPAGRHMTRQASIAELATVDIILCVTGCTIPR